MKSWLIITFIIVPPVTLVGAIDTVGRKLIFHERERGDTVRFFYDAHYYLVDRDCEFRSIERVAPYDFQQQAFVGEFADFDHNGRLILEGNYLEGKRHGDFNAYHPNGVLKWQATYIRGTLQGPLNFYYPDGKPLLEISFTDGGARIVNFWDRRGERRVTNGEGRYEFAVEAEGYNEFGYTRYIRKGKVVDGRPHGNWTIKYLFGDGKEKSAGYEYYNKGRFVQGYEAYTDEEFSDAPRYSLVPIDFSSRAEAMIAKTCTVDDYTGFTGFLAVYLSEWFEGISGRPIEPTKIEFAVVVKASGEPRGLKMKSSFDEKQYADLLLEALAGVDYWLPSYFDGGYIEDTLTVTMEAFPEPDNQHLQFFDVKIKREKGR